MIIGITASIIAMLIGLIVEHWVIPKYKEMIYHGSNINGEWNVYYEEGLKEPFAVIDFKQSGTLIKGVSSVFKNKSNEQLDRKYTYKGTFLNHSIVLTFEDKNNPLMMGGTMVCHYIDADAKKMQGTTLYYSKELNIIKNSQILLVKK